MEILQKNISTALTARTKHKHLALQAQQLPWRYNIRTLRQLTFLHRKFLSIVNQYECQILRSDIEELNYQTVLILLVMLWSGSPIERATDSTKHDKKVRTSDALLGCYDLGEGFVGVRYEWRFKSLERQYQTELTSDKSVMGSKHQSLTEKPA
ncbi:hypothetical protein [Ketobacter sp.]